MFHWGYDAWEVEVQMWQECEMHKRERLFPLYNQMIYDIHQETALPMHQQLFHGLLENSANCCGFYLVGTDCA